MIHALYDLTDCTTEPNAEALLGAMHVAVDAHEMPVKPLVVAPLGSTGAPVVHDGPLSTSTVCTLEPVL